MDDAIGDPLLPLDSGDLDSESEVALSKVSVITIHTAKNYGRRLQSYATQTTIESLGHECELVDYRRRNTTVADIVEKSFVEGRMSLLAPLWRVRPFGAAVRALQTRRVKWYAHPFDEFLASKIHLTHPYYSEDEPGGRSAAGGCLRDGQRPGVEQHMERRFRGALLPGLGACGGAPCRLGGEHRAGVVGRVGA